MKKIFFLFILLNLSFISLNKETVHAGGAVAGALEPTQILNNIELVGVNISDAITAAEQSLSTYKQTIVDPAGALALTIAQKAATDSIISWANSGFEGQPLIISNPEKYIRDAGYVGIKSTLSKVPVDSVLGDSIFNTIVNNNKQISQEARLKELSKSPTASVIQKNACNDPDTLLEKAEAEVEAEGGTIEEINARYEAFYEAICAGDPETDPAVARNIDELARQDSSLGGWDLWLSTTGGHTEEAQVQEGLLLAAKESETRKIFTDKEIFQGEGAISDKKCLAYVKDDDGNDTKDCDFSITLSPGEAVQDAISKAVTSPLERLSNLTGADALTGMLTGFIADALMKGLNSAFSGNSSSQTNTPTVIQTRTPSVQDLKNNQALVTTLTKPMLQNLNLALTKSNTLLSLDREFLQSLATYESRIKAGKACYDALVTDYPTMASDSRVTSAYTFYAGRQSKVDGYRSIINPEIAKILEAQNLMNQTKTKIQSMTSSQDIMNEYNNYSKAIDLGKYPTPQTEGERRTQYQQAKSDAEKDQELVNYGTMCTTLRTQSDGSYWVEGSN